MFQYHPEIAQELGRERQVKDMDAAKRERMLASGRAPHPGPSARRWALALAAAAVPTALVMLWVLVAR